MLTVCVLAIVAATFINLLRKERGFLFGTLGWVFALFGLAILANPIAVSTADLFWAGIVLSLSLLPSLAANVYFLYDWYHEKLLPWYEENHVPKYVAGDSTAILARSIALFSKHKKAVASNLRKPSTAKRKKAEHYLEQWKTLQLELSALRVESERKEATRKRVAAENAAHAKTIPRRRAKSRASVAIDSPSGASGDSGVRKTQKLGKSTLIRPLGSGHFGQVWLGTMPHGPENVPRDVAVKIVKQGLVDSGKQAEVLREMVLLSKLNNPHVVSLLDWPKGAKQEKFWFTTEYVSDRNLQWHIVSEVFDTKGHSGRLSVPRLKRYAEQIFIALAAVERKSIVHKDIKPDNIAITKDAQTIKILDFGLGFVRGRNFSDTRNYFYSAPELIRGEQEPTPKADVYSTGLTILSALLGRDWFEGLNKEQIEYTISNLGPRWDGIDPKAVEFLKPLLAFDPKDRPSAVEVLKHLQSASYFVPWPKGSREYRVAGEFTDLQLKRYAADSSQ